MSVGCKADVASGASCRRCGRCCRLGGPTLHTADAALLTAGTVPLEALVCLRPGEWARDDAAGSLRRLSRELIKTAGVGRGRHVWQCVFFAPEGCRIYASRPVQCAALLCTDTARLQELLAHTEAMDRPTVWQAWANAPTAALPSAAAAWPELTAAYEELCPATQYLDLLVTARTARGTAAAEAAQECAELRRRDAAFRELCIERKAAPAQVLPFLLGRPLQRLDAPARSA